MVSVPIQRLVRRIPLALAVFAAACSSPGGNDSDAGADPGPPLRVVYHSYSGAQHLELVSEGHTSRLEQYSATRANANVKVQTADVMEGLIDLLEDHGFGRHAAEGHFPAEGAGRYAWALEVEGPEGVRHVLAHPGLEPEAMRDLRRYMAAFVDTYNATYALQSVDVDPGQELFKTPGR